MQFQVPQFLDVEDKIIGPLTIKQFIFIAGGLGGAYLIWRVIPWGIIAVLPALGVAVLGAAFAFYRPNNRPFIDQVQSAFLYISKNRLYVWRKREKKENAELDISNLKTTKHAKSIPGAGGSGLHDISWKMDLNKTESVEDAGTEGQF